MCKLQRPVDPGFGVYALQLISRLPQANQSSFQSTVDSRKSTLVKKKLEPRANSNQNRFALAFRHIFTVILPQLGNSKNFSFPRSGHFLYNFTHDNSNHEHEVCTSTVTSRGVLVPAARHCSLLKNLYRSQFLEVSLLLSFVKFFTSRYVPIYKVIQRCIVVFSLDFSIL